MSSLGSGASSGSGYKWSPSSQEDVVQQDVNLHQDCDRSARQRERLTGPHHHHHLPRSRNSANNVTSLSPFISFCKNFASRVPEVNTPIWNTSTYLLKNKTLTLVFLLLMLNEGLGRIADWTVFWGILTFLSTDLLKTTCTNTVRVNIRYVCGRKTSVTSVIVTGDVLMVCMCTTEVPLYCTVYACVSVCVLANIVVLWGRLKTGSRQVAHCTVNV